MASSDKTLGKLSAAFTLVLLAGILAVPFLPMRHIERKSAVPRSSVETASKPAADKESDEQASAEAEEAHEPAGEEQSSASSGEQAQTEELVVWSEQEQAAALRACVALLAPLAVEVEMEEPMRKGQCGAAAPVLLRSIGNAGKIILDPAPKMNCQLAAALARWVETVLQPAAREVMGSRVTHIMGASSYACRNVYNLPNRRLSEHATGNAIDIAAFSLADGRTIRVVNGWGPTERDIAAARKKLEEAKRAATAEKAGADKKTNAAGDGAKAKADNGAGKDAKAGRPVQKTRLEAGGKRGADVEVIPAAATLTAAMTTEAAFLKRLHHGACGVFDTVLGPEANEAHRNHFHFDLKQRTSERRYCH